MALDPIPNMTPMKQSGMTYFGGKDAVKRKKRTAQIVSKQSKQKMFKPTPVYLPVPVNLASKQTPVGQQGV